MARYQVVIKRIVSADGKIIAEAKSVATASVDNQSHINQSVSVDVSSGNNSCSSFSTSSSTSYTK
ncbi:hypothetical protein SAMD00079811_22460 [Scytonema sp. HK-05]|uniref:hypothetical protein n=1 Tax=Scytonema sp. HK-05 TaxID=1137095 RepID=UPI0009374EB1|nr:hypothetical protein [Scytonema sp. HK-05]OKH45515.1 hypothetical protein NIES2130_37190 [Scytonema sp. HK-05]BAY44645.1 hypothetical protein SAMD00079811_22460 [Scytonema sp. HK-05]